MIGKLKGKISEIDGDAVYLETQSGVFYKIFVAPPLLQKKDKVVEVYTHLHVREDELTLFGFEIKECKQIFEYLLTVGGVGPKLAFKIICFSNHDQIILAVLENNVHFFQSIPGVGKKTAQKIVLELSGKLGEEADLQSVSLTKEDSVVVDALKSLGFKRQDIQRALSKVKKDLSVEEKIRDLIQIITKKQ